MRRVQGYGEIQHRYKKRRSELARNILVGIWREQAPSLTAERLTELWKLLMVTDSSWGPCEIHASDRILTELCAPKTTEHVVAAQQGVSGSPGPDGLTWKAVKAHKEWMVLVSLFNSWLCVELCSLQLCRGITTLIPKEIGTLDPAKY